MSGRIPRASVSTGCGSELLARAEKNIQAKRRMRLVREVAKRKAQEKEEEARKNQRTIAELSASLKQKDARLSELQTVCQLSVFPL